MSRDLLFDCLPWLFAIAIGMGLLRLLWRLSGAQWRPSVLAQLPADECGAVQSLSFVLTVPLFVMVLMFIVQLTQITLARLVVEYAAYAAVRSAIVWVPADAPLEPPNHVGVRVYRDSTPGGMDTYDIGMIGHKAHHIQLAAIQACVPISPARTLPNLRPPSASQWEAMWIAYQVSTPNNDSPRRARVLYNKLAWAEQHTRVTLSVQHPHREPPLLYYWPLYNQFWENEIGWRDALVVTVSHDYALLPGPGRWLARWVSPTDSVAPRTTWRSERVYTYPLSATMTMTNEGQRSVRTYRQVW